MHSKSIKELQWSCKKGTLLPRTQPKPHLLKYVFIFWCIWLERNSRCFEGIERNILELKWSLIHTLWDWNNAYGEVYFHSVLDFQMLVLLKFFLYLVFLCTLLVYLVFNFNQISLLSIKNKRFCKIIFASYLSIKEITEYNLLSFWTPWMVFLLFQISIFLPLNICNWNCLFHLLETDK